MEKFLQLDVKVPKDKSETVTDFFLRSGAISSAETLYEEEKTNNLDNDDTWLQFAFREEYPVNGVVVMAMELLEISDYEYHHQIIKTADILAKLELSLHPFPVGKSFLLVPSLKNMPEKKPDYPNIIIINPAFAFGTGQHETTQLMMEYLEDHVRPGMSVIDMGCGSGILSIASLILGADSVHGIDIEELSYEASEQNKGINADFQNASKKKLPWDQLYFYKDDFSWLEKKPGIKHIDLFVANILPGVFQNNREAFRNYLAISGQWVLSGIYRNVSETFLTWLSALPENKERQIRTMEKNGWFLFYSG